MKYENPQGSIYFIDSSDILDVLNATRKIHVQKGIYDNFPGLCSSIRKASLYLPGRYPAAQFLKNLISERLENNIYYGGWMREHHRELWDASADKHQRSAKLKEGRLAWLDSLIEEFSE